MAVRSQQNMDQFEAYFRRADLDQDGRISGNEAVAFFLGSNLPRPVLAQIWVLADHNRTGFLGRQEFYNALKLVTVAQSKRELTPEIVKAALYGPASVAIPPPRINLTPAGSQQPSVLNSSSSAPPPSVVTTTASPKVGASGPHGFVSQLTQVSPSARPLSPPQVAASRAIPPHGNTTVSYPSHASTSTAVNTVVSMAGVNSQGNKAVMPIVQGGLTTPLSGLMSVNRPVSQVSSPSVQPALSKPNDTSVGGKGEQKDSKTLTVGGNGHTPDSFGDIFSASPVQTNLDSVKVNSFISSTPAPSAIVPASSESQLTAKPSPFKSLPSPPTPQPTNSQHPQVHNQHFFAHGSSLPTGVTMSGGQSQPSWPRMAHSDIQKYSKVFTQVDTDRDGRITGEQARNLFLSWKIPRDVLKQVWDLSDQDNDSMLSLREFCIALYLMERYREGRPLPAALPINIMPDETMFSVSSQPGAPQKTTLASKPPRPVPAPQLDDAVQPNRQKPKVPVLEKHLVDQLSTEEQNSLNAKLQEATEAEKKVAELEKEILDAREKIQFYNTNMKELVIHKGRYDGRLNDISQMISVEKLEVDKLAKKYEEKCRQSGDVASRLTIEESTFRDIQEKKMELYRAIVKLDQEGTAEKIQERASHIQADLEELVKSLNERCRSYGLRAKPTSLVELPFGWQPGVQGTAADWEENWDKFEDEGFTVVKELTSDVQDVIAPPKPKSTLVRDKETSDRGTAKLSSGGHVKADNVQQNEEKISDDGENTHDEDQKPDDSPKSPARGNGLDSKSNEFEDSKKTGSFDGSPRAAQSEHGGTESVSSGDKGFDGPGWGRFDNTDAAWDFNRVTAKDSDSLFGSDGWNLQPIKTGLSSTDSTLLKLAPPNFDSVPSTPMNYSGSSPQADNLFQRKSPFYDSVPSTPLYNSGTSPHADNFSLTKSPFVDSVPSTPMYNFNSTPRVDNNSLAKSPFVDSVPSTPMYNFGSSPKKGPFADSVPSTPMYGNASEDRSFDSFSRFDSFNMPDSNNSFSRFDSFNMQDGGLFASRDSSLSRFDSMRSTKDSEFDHGPFASRDSFARFDSFRSTADSDYNFGVFPSRDNANLTRFDSIRSTSDTADHSHGFSSFDDADPFGTHDPFKTSAETPRRDSDSWKAF